MNEMSTDASENPEVQISRADLTEAVRATAILADITVAVWSGESTDRTLSDKIKEDAGAIGNTGKYVKNLLAGCDDGLKSVKSTYQGARNLHYKLTLPWASSSITSDKNMGPRLLPNMLFDNYLTQMGKLRREAHKKLDEFLHNYPDLVVRAQANLAGLAKAEDYPSVEDVRKRFKLSFDFTPIPASNAFQGLPDAMLEKLGAQLRRRQEAAVAVAQGAMWDRAKEAVGHLVERLDEPDKEFKVNSVDAVRNLITLLPGFNCAGDPRVTTVVEDIDRMLSGVSAEQLRKNLGVRSDVVKQAQAIADKMKSWGL